MNPEKIHQSATAEYWATVDRIGDGESVPTTTPPPRRSIWRLLAVASGAFLIIAGIIGIFR